MNIQQLIEEIGKETEEELTDMQIAARLRECFEKLKVTHKFTPGQIIRHKIGKYSSFKSGPKPVLFLEYLDKPVDALAFCESSAEAMGNSASEILDCRVAVWRNGTFFIHLMPSHEHEPHPEFTEDTDLAEVAA